MWAVYIPFISDLKHKPWLPMSKIFQPKETFDLKEGGERPTAIGMKSGVGFEFLYYEIHLLWMERY